MRSSSRNAPLAVFVLLALLGERITYENFSHEATDAVVTLRR